jgi:amyloid beta precursor protein binding protein 1
MATDNKYDRQLRLWGAHGQKILSNSTILVLGSSPSASECLKNLILPQIKKYVIVDDGKITLRDLG